MIYIIHVLIFAVAFVGAYTYVKRRRGRYPKYIHEPWDKRGQPGSRNNTRSFDR